MHEEKSLMNQRVWALPGTLRTILSTKYVQKQGADTGGVVVRKPADFLI
jgi:hypothetical protein